MTSTRILFVAYLAVITLGSLYFLAIGLLGR